MFKSSEFKTAQQPSDLGRVPDLGIRTLSLFSGAGGLDLGFLQAGYDIVACVEIEQNYCETLKANVGSNQHFGSRTNVHQVDVRQFEVSKYRDSGIRCVIGGPPCQTFSAAGRRAGGVIGTEDERGQLFQAYCRVLDELRPEVFVFENVYGLPGANGGKPWSEICEAFSKRGYNLSWQIVDAADYGVPQHRERLIMVGSRTGTFVFPLPTHGPDSSSDRELVSVLSAISDLQDPEEPFHDSLGGMYGHLLPQVPEGLNYSYFTAEMNHPAPVFAWRSKFHDLLYKVDRNAPCRTLKAQPGKFTGPFHWKNRHFKSAELKRLQTFPDDYTLCGSPAVVLEQIGNSVPPKLAKVMAAAVREQLLEPASTLQYPTRPPDFQSTFRQRQRQKSARFHKIAKEANAALAQEQGSALKGMSGTYWQTQKNLFDNMRHTKPNGLPSNALKVSVSEKSSHITVHVARLDGKFLPASQIEISGLRKYLPGYDSLSVSARISSPAEIFHVWAAVEEALTSRSRFFTLIDIYGHYANRGDTVQIDANWRLAASSQLTRTLNFFGDNQNCGAFIKATELANKLEIEQADLNDVINEMRLIRFDARTHKTHPIIKQNMVLCTYPFPLLSPRAMVESKVRLTKNSDILKIAKAS